MSAGKGDIRTIADGLLPNGLNPEALTRIGRDEVRAALDALLRIWDRDNARLGLALEQLDKGADEIERLRAALQYCENMAAQEGSALLAMAIKRRVGLALDGK